MNNRNLLVIIVTYNAMQWIERCLESVKNSSVVSDVFIVDNGSTDGTQDYIKVNYPEFMFFQSEYNLGFGQANNIGLKYALEHEYDYVYLLNQDAWVKDDTLGKLIDVHKSFPEYGVLSPIQMQANEQHMDVNFVKNVCSYKNCKRLLDDLLFCRKESVYEVKFVMAAHWLISRACINIVGGFSPSFPHYGEDDNYLDRVLFHGLKVGIVPNTFSIHDREHRKMTESKEMYFDSYIVHLITASSIHKIQDVSLMFLWAKNIKNVLKHKSLVPLKYAFILLVKWRVVKSNKERSKKRFAFM